MKFLAQPLLDASEFLRQAKAKEVLLVLMSEARI